MKTTKDTSAWEKVVENSLDIICTVNREGIYVSINEACEKTLGYKKEELVGLPFSSFPHPEDVDSTLSSVEKILQGKNVNNFRNRIIHKNREEVFIRWSAVWSPRDELILCVGRDVTEQERALQKDKLYEAMIEQGSDLPALFDEELNFLYCESSTFRELGYQPEQLLGTNAFSYIHPDDVAVVKESLLKSFALKDRKITFEFRFRDADGEWKWLETRAGNQLHNPAVKAFVTSSRNITERINHRLKLQESEQRFKSLFENHPDMVFFQNKEGVVIDVNPATLSFLGLPKEFFLGQKLYDLLSPDKLILQSQLPPEMMRLQEETLQKALNGEAVRFEAELPLAEKELKTFDVAKIPVIVKGEPIGVYTILRDITEVSQTHSTIKRQAEKLNTIFESITDAFFTLDRDWTITCINNEFRRLLHLDGEELTGKNLWEVFPGEVNGEFYRQYNHAVETGKSVHFNAWFRKLNIWLQVKAFPSEEGLSVYFADVTENIRSRNELEKLSLVASKTTNGVVITDAEGRVEWVNSGFTNLTGYPHREVAGKNLSFLLFGEETDKTTIQKLRESRKQGRSFNSEVLIYKKEGEKIWITLEVTPVLNEAGEVTKFTSIQTDITFRKEAEASQLQLTEDLFRQNRDLQQFSYIVSHNLRAPVANAMGLVNLLTTTDKGSDTFDLSLSYLKTNAKKLDTILRDLNMILSIRDKRGVVENENIPLAELCREPVDRLREQLNATGGEVSIEIDENIVVQGNKAYFYSVFYNLLSNSIRFRSAERPLKVLIRCVGNTENEKIITFSDNGSGFDLQKAGDNVFRLYKRFHSNSEGRGLGLFLVKTQLEAMEGRIEVSSEVNKGTGFLIRLK